MGVASNSSLPDSYWERIGDATRQGRYISAIQRRIITFAGSTLHSGGCALEVGCESGRWSKLLADLGWKMTCVDVDARELSKCQAKVPSANCVLASPEATTLPVETASQQLLLCIEVRPVIQSNWFCTEASRVLQAGGLAVGLYWNSRSLRALLHKVEARRSGTQDFYTSSYSEWRTNFQRLGFDFIQEEGLCWGPFKRDSDSNLIPVFATLERGLGLHKLPSLSPWIMFTARKTMDGQMAQASTV